MPSRLELQHLFEKLIGNRNVYFQPPASYNMNYPAIVYGLSDIMNSFSNDTVYSSHRKYMVTVIDEDPDSIIVEKIAALPACKYDRHFESENLNHDVFILHY